MDAAVRPALASSRLGAFATASVSASIAVMFMGSTLLTPLYPLYRRRFGFPELVLTLVYAVYVIGNLSALLVFGRVSDQIGRRAALLPAMALAAVSAVLFLAAESTAWLFAGRMVSGLAIAIASGVATAWLAELYPERERGRASLAASAANLLGLALGAVTAGLLSQYARWPLRLSYAVYLAILAASAAAISGTPETVRERVRSLRRLSLKPRIGIPESIRKAFLAPAVTAFATFALLGFYFALAPSVLLRDLHEANRAVAGAIMCELCLAAIGAAVLTRRSRSRTTMLSGLVLMLPSVLLLALAQRFGSMPILLAGTASSGISTGLGYRGSLQVVNDIAPPDRRAEVLSSYLLACYAGNSLPVIGVGVLATLWTFGMASGVFAGLVALLALGAIATGLKHLPRSRERDWQG